MKRYLLSALLISSCAVAAQTLAYDLNDAANTVNQAANTVNAVQETNARFTDAERNTYQEYFNKESNDSKHENESGHGNYKNNGNSGNNGHDKKYSSLPPGLQKKVASGGSLPPGWQKKVENGQVFSPELRNYSTRSPYASPKGTTDYILDNKVVRVLDATNVILDVLTN